MTKPFAIALRAGASLGEGAIWDSASHRLLWVDITGKSVGRFDPVTGGNDTFILNSLVGAVVPTCTAELLVATQEGIARLDPSNGCLSKLIAPPGHDPTATRFNDGKCDPAGRFLVGTTSLSGVAGAAALYSFSPDGSVRPLLTGVSISNGIGWSPDGKRMYYVDTPTRVIAAFDYDVESGALDNRRVAVEVPASLGYPDGLTVDAEGMIWLALWGGSAVTRWNPLTGRLLERYALPASQITSCAFGGAALDTLFVTSARDGLSPSQLESEPLAGSIFSLAVNTRGMPAARFGS